MISEFRTRLLLSFLSMINFNIPWWKRLIQHYARGGELQIKDVKKWHKKAASDQISEAIYLPLALWDRLPFKWPTFYLKCQQ